MKYFRAVRICVLALSTLLASTGVAMATQPNGVDTELIGRSAVAGPFSADDPQIQLALDKATDLAVVHGTMAPGGDTGWHSHPDVVFVQITEGTLTLYAADDPNCSPQVMQAGQGFIEPIGKVHIARNESQTDRVSWYATHIGVPPGVPTTTDSPAPGNCPF
jgi:quercetin dioxygenase-like cupin family protein